MTNFSNVSSNSTDQHAYQYMLERTHGILEITAWMLSVSIGLIVARYFKPAWPNSMLFKAKLWFTIHRFWMVAGLLLNAAGFILIFAAKRGRYLTDLTGYEAAHPPIGIVVTILVIVNPIVALFRCNPGDTRRPIFDWTHSYIGYTAFILSIINMFFGLAMLFKSLSRQPAAGWVMFAFVMLHIGAEVVLNANSKLGLGRRLLSSRRHSQSPVTAAEHHRQSLQLAALSHGDGSLLNNDHSRSSTPHSTSFTNQPSGEDTIFLYTVLAIYVSGVTGLWIAEVVLLCTN